MILNNMSLQELIPIKQFCKTVNISRSNLYNLIKRGEGPRTVKIGDSRRILRSDAEAWLASLPEAGR